MTRFFRTLCLILMGVSLGFLAYKKIKQSYIQKEYAETNAMAVKKLLLKYKKPVRVEVQNFVKDPQSRFHKDITDIQNLKVFYDQNSNYYIELQMFTDENDSQAPLVVQCRFLDIKNKNLIQEQSLNLY